MSSTGDSGRPFRAAARTRLLAHAPTWLSGIVAVGGVALLLFELMQLVDARVLAVPRRPLQNFFEFDLETAQNALGNLAQMVVAVLGITITVVAIVVQLAATRYTPRVTNLFFRDRTNLLVLGFFASSSLYALWLSLAPEKGFMPSYAILVGIAMVSGCILVLIPYFSYVFTFLEPERVIRRLEEDALQMAVAPLDRGTLAARQGAVLDHLEQLADIAINAISQNDRIISTRAVDALTDLAIRYLHQKPAEPDWFRLSDRLRANPDFIALAPQSLLDLEDQRLWLEFKVFRQYQAIFTEAIGELREVAPVVAIDLRRVAEAAMGARDRLALDLSVKFLNTILRACLTQKDVRTAYNVLHQYRLLCENMLLARLDQEAVQCAEHLRYYAQVAHGMRLGFVTETAAYDLATLCESAALSHAPVHRRILEVLLQVDKESEDAAQEVTLRGVRKAQAKLASFYLQRGDEEAVRLIHDDMAHERPERLRSIREELLNVKDKYFWEIVDRGVNFDYLEPDRKALLVRFFEGFPQLGRASREAGAG